MEAGGRRTAPPEKPAERRQRRLAPFLRPAFFAAFFAAFFWPPFRAVFFFAVDLAFFAGFADRFRPPPPAFRGDEPPLRPPPEGRPLLAGGAAAGSRPAPAISGAVDSPINSSSGSSIPPSNSSMFRLPVWRSDRGVSLTKPPVGVKRHAQRLAGSCTSHRDLGADSHRDRPVSSR